MLYDYARRWGLTVNVDKTKAVIFRAASTPVCSNPSMMYDGTSIAFVESFKYLGVDMHCTQPFADAGLPRKESGQRAMLDMLHRCRELGIDDPLLQVRLFDALVQPVMMYAVELWGASGVAKGELAGDLVQRDFLRRLLGLTREGTLAFGNLPEARGDEEEQQLQARMGIRIGLCRPQADYVTTHSTKGQQYLRMREDVNPDTYSMAPYLRAVGGWRQRKRLAQLRTGSHWLGVESGRSGSARVPRDHN